MDARDANAALTLAPCVVYGLRGRLAPPTEDHLRYFVMCNSVSRVPFAVGVDMLRVYAKTMKTGLCCYGTADV